MTAATLQVLNFKAISKRHCRVVPCSAVTGEGILEGFDWLVKDISSRIYLFDH
jgi:ADP-ribosylation factor-like protein 2